MALSREFERLCATVWHAIKHALPQDVANMRHSLVLALAQCIEDDGHRVCGVGQRQRFINVVEAQSCTPAEKVSALTQVFDGEYPAPTAENIRDFVVGAHEEASALLGHGTAELADFERQLAAYVSYTY